jgi:hypothetical protein
LRVNASDFAKLLDIDYIKENAKEYKKLLGDDFSASNSAQMASYLYDNADKLLDLDYIIIDGGNAEARRRAGYALLFRFILCDKWGIYKECSEIHHAFQSINTDDGDLHRNTVARRLKKYDVLFLAEFYKKLMSVHFETGSFFDEVFVARRSSLKVTILSFSENITEDNKIMNKDYGVTFADLSRRLKPGKRTLRIKVVPYESE